MVNLNNLNKFLIGHGIYINLNDYIKYCQVKLDNEQIDKYISSYYTYRARMDQLDTEFIRKFITIN